MGEVEEMRIPALFYRLGEWLMSKREADEIHESFYDGQWHIFSCWVRWREDKNTIEFDAPCLEEGNRYMVHHNPVWMPAMEAMNKREGE